MKKKTLFGLGVLFFVALLVFNLQQTRSSEIEDSKISSLELEENTAMADLSWCDGLLGGCTPVGCEISGYTSGPFEDPDEWYFQYYGCAPSCTYGGSNCCFTLNYTNC